MTPDESGENARRAEMLASVSDAIAGGDEQFAVETLATQGFIGAVDVVEYVALRARNENNPVRSQRWEEVLDNYCTNHLQLDELSRTIEFLLRPLSSS